MCAGKYVNWITPEGTTLISGWRMEGLTHLQVAENIGINVCTLYDWAKKYPEISNALKKGKDVADYTVINALFRNATGYWNEETVIDSKGNEHTIQKWYPPNVTAQIFYLKNRRPAEWKDKRDVDISTEENNANFGVVLLPERKPVTDEH